MGLAATLRQYTSISHVQTAALLCRQTAKAQEEWSGTGGPTFDELGGQAVIAYATGTVFSAVAFVEANVNELLLDCSDGALEEPSRKALGPSLCKTIGSLWPGPPRWPTVAKWRDILQTVGKTPGLTVESDWIALNRLRNGLVHAKPESVTVMSNIPEIPETIHSLESLCKGRFEKNPKVKGRAGFLLEYLAYPCSRWAVQTAVAYADHVWYALGTSPPYEHVRARLAQ